MCSKKGGKVCNHLELSARELYLLASFHEAQREHEEVLPVENYPAFRCHQKKSLLKYLRQEEPTLRAYPRAYPVDQWQAEYRVECLQEEEPTAIANSSTGG